MEETTDPNGSFRTLISNDSVDSDTSPDQEVLFRASSTSNSLLQMWGVLRASGGADNETGYVCGLAGGELRILSYKNGVNLGIQGAYAFNWNANTFYWVRFRVHGVTLLAKVWAGALQISHPLVFICAAGPSTPS